jgi:hypothetical protein
MRNDGENISRLNMERVWRPGRFAAYSTFALLCTVLASRPIHAQGGPWQFPGATSGGGGGTITGSGVANRVTFWTGTSAIGGNTGFTFDPTTGSLVVTGVGGFSGLNQGASGLNQLAVSNTATTVNANQPGAALNMSADATVAINTNTGAITLSAAGNINLGSNALVTPAGALTVTSCTGCGGGTAAFSALTGGTNTGAAMVVGTGASLTVSGSGTINATTLGGATFAAPGAIGGTTPAAGTFTTLIGQTSLRAGVVGTTAGVLNLSGSTSGTATFTAPAVAGTTTNPVTMSNTLLGPVGSATNVTFAAGQANTGLYEPFAGQPVISAGGTPSLRVLSTQVLAASAALFGWTNGGDAITGSTDTGISRISGGVVGIGNGTAGDTTGNLQFGKVTKYNGTATAGDGLASILFTATQTAQVAAISDTTMVTVGGTSTLYRFVGEINCTATSAAAQAALNLKWTDTGSQAQTLTVTDTCTALGSGSVADMVHAIRAKTGTTITYGVTITNTPTYDVDVRLEVM